MLGSREDAEDVLQEVFAAAFNAMLADDRPINVRPWLYRIARNRSLNHLRRQQAIGVDSMDVHLSEGGLTTADKVHKREEFRALIGDVQELPETQKTALLLREIDALSYEQIAETMETTVPSVKSLLVRARVALAEMAEARKLTCEEVREELGEVAEGLKRTTPPVRRHLRTCDRCTTFRKSLRDTNKALASVMPVAPLLLSRSSCSPTSARPPARAAARPPVLRWRGRRRRRVGRPGHRRLQGRRGHRRGGDRVRRRRRGQARAGPAAVPAGRRRDRARAAGSGAAPAAVPPRSPSPSPASAAHGHRRRRAEGRAPRSSRRPPRRRRPTPAEGDAPPPPRPPPTRRPPTPSRSRRARPARRRRRSGRPSRASTPPSCRRSSPAPGTGGAAAPPSRSRPPRASPSPRRPAARAQPQPAPQPRPSRSRAQPQPPLPVAPPPPSPSRSAPARPPHRK
jgi:RNA polymerase sigma factor (sigma-70 family)